MTNSWKSDCCEALANYHEIYTVPIAAAMWCGVPANQTQDALKEASPVSAFDLEYGVWQHPDIPDLVTVSCAITRAIDGGSLPCCLKDGTVTKSIPYDQRYIHRHSLIEWVENEPSFKKPAFLFDDIARNTHTVITVSLFQSVQAQRDTAISELKSATDMLQFLGQEKSELEKNVRILNAAIGKMRSEGSDKLPESERESLVKLALGMAVGGYSYDPSNKRNAATGDNRGSIAADLARIGLAMDSDTIRKFINEGSERFSDKLSIPDKI